MRILLIITFSLIMVYVNIGYYVQVSVQKELAQWEMKERIFKSIPDSSLTCFDLSSIENEIAWKEEGKEFWLNNELFDLVKTSFINGKRYLYCLNDRNEEKI